MKYKKYAEYKDSGVDWIGEIPKDWQLKKFKYIFKLKKGKNPINLEMDAKSSKYLPYLSMEYLRGNGGNTTFAIPEQNSILVNKDDILILWDGSNAGEIVIAKEGILSSTMAVAVTKSTNKNFLKKYLHGIERIIRSYTTGMGIPHVNTDFLINLPIIGINNNEEQELISNFLDKETTRIDKLIDKNIRLIELLKEKRQAVINQAVTKGVDQSAKLKPSGIDWIGDIPEHWDNKRLRYVAKCQNGISKSAEFFGSGFPFVSYGDVYKNIELPTNVEGLVESTESDRENYSVKEGDVFFTRTSETIEEIGLTCVCKSTIKNATFAGFLIRVRPEQNVLDMDFSKYYFSSNIHRKFFVKEMNIVTRASLGQELLKKLPILIPPIEEQKFIAKYLNDKTSKIDTSISKIEQLIEKLKEYKQTLISNVVTGKIDVRDCA